MTFNSLIFLVFAGLFFALWPIFRKRDNSRWGLITVASLIFYGWWDWRFLFLLVGTGLVDYFAAIGIQRSVSRKKAILVVSLVSNLGALAVFKYSAFIAELLDGILLFLHVPFRLGGQVPEFTLILPVGISFYTFQSMSYTIDVYRGHTAPAKNLLHFFAFLSLFPQLVAGPILRATDLLPQLLENRRASSEQLWEGWKLIVFGFVKKCIFADNFAPVVQTIWANTPTATSLDLLAGAILFAMQIYCDFSGYSDIARGLGKWMGYDFAVNFNHPYHSTSLREFWNRWHISLSSWFRDYLYIPLGGSKKGERRWVFNLWVTFFLSGLWHGASWNFVLWGNFHFLGLLMEKTTRYPERLSRSPFGPAISWLLTMMLVLVGWIFFRSSSSNEAAFILQKIVAMDSLTTQVPGITWLLLVSIVVAEFFSRLRPVQKWDVIVPRLAPFGTALLAVGCIFLRGPGSVFIYFRF